MFITQDVANQITASQSDAWPGFAKDPGADFWYHPIGTMSAAGYRVSPDQALRLNAVWACVLVIAEALGHLPLHTFRREGEGKERAFNHPIYRLLHDRPNEWQTAIEWRTFMQGCLLLNGNAYSEIKFAPNGRIMELIPLHPDRMAPERIGEIGVRYVYRDREGGQRILPAGDVMHIRAFSRDGVCGLNPVEHHAGAIGYAMAAEDYGQRFYRNDARPGGVIEFDGNFKDTDARNNFMQQWQAAHTGANRHKWVVLEKGMKMGAELGIKHTDAQYLETLKLTAEQIARIYRVPPHMIGSLDRATFNNIEHLGIEFVTHTLMPWLVRWEQSISRDLIRDEQQYFAEFDVNGLLRGDNKTRGEFYQSAIQQGWMTRNEVRARENMNPLDGLDEPLEPQNMAPPGQNDEPPPNSREAMLAYVAAQKVVNRLTIATRRAFEKDEEVFDAWADQYFAEQAPFVSESMVMPRSTADQFMYEMRQELSGDIPGVLARWEATKAGELARLV